MREPRPVRLPAVLLACLALFTGGAHAADLFYNATLSMRMGDDSRFFLNLTNQHFAPPEKVAVAVVRQCPRPADDFPVVMLIAAAAGKPSDAVLAMRLRGMSWAEVLFRLDVSPQVLFAGMDRDPGPPYGHAWGYWKSHQRRAGSGPKTRFEISDAQVVDFAKLQIAASYYRVSPYSVIGERQRGVTVERYTVVHGRPSGKVASVKNCPPERGHGNGQGNGHGHGNGHGGQNNQKNR